MSSSETRPDETLLQSLVKNSSTQLSIDHLTLLVKTLYYSEIGQSYAPAQKEESYAIAANLLAAMQRRNSAFSARISLGELTPQQNIARSACICIVAADMPFVIDSVTEMLQAEGFIAERIVHTVLNVERDASGALQAIYPLKSKRSNHQLEVIAHIKIQGKFEPVIIERLQPKLEQCLRKVNVVVDDWKHMLEDMTHLTLAFGEAAIGLTRAEQKWYKEIQAFIQWLGHEHFTFLGTQNGRNSSLGLCKDVDGELQQEITRVRKQALADAGLQPEIPLAKVGKLDYLSPVHRRVNLDCVIFVLPNADKPVVCVLIGLFTTRLPYQSIRDIPIVRLTIHDAIEKSGLAHISHSRKELLSLLEDFPREALFLMKAENLLSLCTQLLGLLDKPAVRFFQFSEHDARFVHGVVTVPMAQYSRRLVHLLEDYVAKAYKGAIDRATTYLSNPHLARIHLLIKRHHSKALPNLALVEEHVVELAEDWYVQFRNALDEAYPAEQAVEWADKYQGAFTEHFCEAFSARKVARHDIPMLEQALETGIVNSALYQVPGEPDLVRLKLYSPNVPMILSKVMPTLDNIGFITLDSTTYPISYSELDKPQWVHHFVLQIPGLSGNRVMSCAPALVELLHEIWRGNGQNDSLNTLVLRAALDHRQIMILRAYAAYLHQVGAIYSKSYFAEVLARNANVTTLLMNLFEVRHNPRFKGDRNKIASICLAQIAEALSLVQSSAEDQLLRKMQEVILATLRTNAYQPDAMGAAKNYISFKMQSSLVPFMPQPVPYAEIFVFAKAMEGIHLRGGKVARGGIRWSDRHDDFRTEVLGLMKAQMAKNSVIVPVGSKGGFIIKESTEAGREAINKQAIACYVTLLRGMLDLTDNLKAGQNIVPRDVVCHDAPDPYLVVAADKGTATFSDTANAISAEYGFWLGDAFASGGSAGYDHKKMAITARGSWISIYRHFYELGVDTTKDNFTVAGIGDMSGDVFGNGMLLNHNICLIAAFNHQHIFLDPSPDPATSFAERERLFKMPRSSWEDYALDCISKGGGIYARSAKSIALSAEAKVALNISEDQLTPEGLIRAILKSPVDLLYNGGIGTYVKASDEINEQVGDKANDAVRINGSELRCRLVGEGGNLGFTQRGRIEYARIGGKINTDAIDNSAGVDCSDHEVNIKIALTKAIEAGEIGAEQRNQLLETMTDSVAQLVLQDNLSQTLVISLEYDERHALLELHRRLILQLEQEGLLDRKIEFLPTDAEIERRAAAGEGLTRPEIAVLLAYTKMSIDKKILGSNLPDDEYFVDDLQSYFPASLQQHIPQAIATHPLRREIISTSITNNMVNILGPTFCQLALDDTGLAAEDMAQAFALARRIAGANELVRAIEATRSLSCAKDQYALYRDLKRSLHKITLWFMRNVSQPAEVSSLATEFAAAAGVYSSRAEILVANARENYEYHRQTYVQANIPEGLAEEIATRVALSAICDIVRVASRTGWSGINVGRLYYLLEARCHFRWLRAELDKVSLEDYWQRLAVTTLKEDIYDLHRRLTLDVINVVASANQAQVAEEALQIWESNNLKQIQRFDALIEDMQLLSTTSLSQLYVAAKRVQGLFKR